MVGNCQYVSHQFAIVRQFAGSTNVNKKDRMSKGSFDFEVRGSLGKFLCELTVGYSSTIMSLYSKRGSSTSNSLQLMQFVLALNRFCVIQFWGKM